ncbi:acyltransferase [Prochlorococcus marinus]|uniref:acyltransferase n=1 Tax=Prochlorococcus marinus TaxID=1219 RepID=UPI001CED669E|nr:acyltransferase [Prochlorococcus marinus]
MGGVFGGIATSNQLWLFFMPISLFILWSGNDKKLANFIWGFFFILVSHSWLLELHPLTWLGFSSISSFIIAISILLGCSLIGGILVSLWGLLSRIIYLKKNISEMNFLPLITKVLLLSFSWGIGEFILSQTPLFWIGLGEGIVPGDMYLAGLARWIGASGLCIVQLIIGFWLYLIYEKWKRKYHLKKTILFGLLIIVILHFIGGLTKPIDRNNDFPVALWQPNMPTREKIYFNNEFMNDRLIAAQKIALSNKAKLLITPEGTFNNNFNLSFKSKIEMLAGGFRNSANGLRSSLLGYQVGDKTHSSFIDKNRLVPLGEKVPRFLNIFSKGLSAVGGIQPGPNSRLFEWKFTPPLAIAICYEISDEFKIRNAVKSGAELIISVANLDPYPTKLHDQFISLASLRSIENKKDNVIVSNTGPSGIISEEGRVIKLFDPNTEQNEVVNPNFSKVKTFYTRYGERPLFLLFLFLVGLNLFFGKFTN